MIRFACTGCGRQLQATPDKVGQKRHCPVCHTLVEVADDITSSEASESQNNQFDQPRVSPVNQVRSIRKFLSLRVVAPAIVVLGCATLFLLLFTRNKPSPERDSQARVEEKSPKVPDSTEALLTRIRSELQTAQPDLTGLERDLDSLGKEEQDKAQILSLRSLLVSADASRRNDEASLNLAAEELLKVSDGERHLLVWQQTLEGVSRRILARAHERQTQGVTVLVVEDCLRLIALDVRGIEVQSLVMKSAELLLQPGAESKRLRILSSQMKSLATILKPDDSLRLKELLQLRQLEAELAEGDQQQAVVAAGELLSGKRTLQPTTVSLIEKRISRMTQQYRESEQSTPEPLITLLRTIEKMEDDSTAQSWVFPLVESLVEKQHVADNDFVFRKAMAVLNEIPPDPQLAFRFERTRTLLSRQLLQKGIVRLRAGEHDSALNLFQQSVELCTLNREFVRSVLGRSFHDQPEKIPAWVKPLPDLPPEESFWSLIPHDAEAVSAVRNLKSVSDKVDQLAKLARLPPPKLLATAIARSGINEGLDAQGDLVFVKMPVTVSNSSLASGMTYLLPCDDDQKLLSCVRPMRKHERFVKPPDIRQVRMYHLPGAALSLSNYVAFAEQRDLSVLESFRAEELKKQSVHIEPLNLWDKDLDGYFVVTQEGIRSRLRSLNIPLVSGFVRIEAILSMLDESRFQSIKQFAAGFQIQNDSAALLRAKTWLSRNDLDESELLNLPEFAVPRDTVLDGLPDLPFFVAIGAALTPEQSQRLSEIAHESLGTPDRDLQVDSLQIALYHNVAPLPVEGAKREGKKGEIWPFEASDIPNVLISIRLPVSDWLVESAKKAILQLPWQDQFGGNPPEKFEVQDFPQRQVCQLRLMNEPGGLDRVCVIRDGRSRLLLFIGHQQELEQILQALDRGTRITNSQLVSNSLRMLPEHNSAVVVADVSRCARYLARWSLLANKEWLNAQFLELARQYEEEAGFAMGVTFEKTQLMTTIAVTRQSVPIVGTVLSWCMPLMPLWAHEH